MATLDSELTRPSHYGGEANPFEPIKIIEHYGLDFCLGNAVKYILRAGRKGSETVEADLAKAEWYVHRARGEEPDAPTPVDESYQRLPDIYDEESYMRGMEDATGMPSLVLRTVIYALQESGFSERFVAEWELNQEPTSAVEVERVRLLGEDGFIVKIVPFNANTGRVNDMVIDGETVTGPIISDPGDEVEHLHHED